MWYSTGKLGNMIYNGLITHHLYGFPFAEIRSLQAPVAVTTQRLPSLVASSDPTIDVPATSQAAPALAQTQTASATLPATEGQSA